MARSNDYSQWFWRDRWNGIYVGLAFAVVCSSAIFLAPYFASLRHTPLRIQSKPIHRPLATGEDAYSGAIVFASPGSDSCSRFSFDNKTGRVSHRVQLPCDDAVQELVERKAEQSAGITRLEAISRAMRGE